MSQTPKRILVVDDEKWIFQHMFLPFHNAGYTAEFASSAEDALIDLKDNKYDLIISDCVLPGNEYRHGYFFLEKVRETSTTPFILMSADDLRETLFMVCFDENFLINLTGFYKKPVPYNFESLLYMIETVFLCSELDAPIGFHNAVLNLAQKTGDVVEEKYSLRVLGRIYEHRGQVDKAKDYFKQAEKL